MPEIRLVPASPRPFAGVRRVVPRREISRELMAGLDLVWSVIRSRNLGRGGHNIAVYREIDRETVGLECGVEVGDGFEPDGEIRMRTTPGGIAARATHAGPVQQIGETYTQIHDWLEERGMPGMGVAWEIYGHADEATGEFDTEVFVLVSTDR